MREFRSRWVSGIAVLLCTLLVAACGGSPAGVTAVPSTGTGVTGRPADTPVSCAAPLDATALLPGSATPAATAAGPPIPVDPEFAQMANVLATGVAAWDSGGLSLVGWGWASCSRPASPAATSARNSRPHWATCRPR